MNIISIILIALGLTMDAFAVSLTLGLKTDKSIEKKIALKAGLYFGGFQALMPLIGWLLGVKFSSYIENIDHWIAFVLLFIIGAKMIKESFETDEDESIACDSDNSKECITNKKFLLLAIATSIDALAVGVSFAFLKVEIISSVAIIGVTTMVLSFIAVLIGKKLGELIKNKAEILGGTILILIGLKILVEHLMSK